MLSTRVKSNFIYSTLNGQYHQDDRIKKDEMGGACRKGAYRVLEGTLEEK